MMPGFRHANRKTKMHSDGERCFYLNTGHDHSSTAHKILFASRVASYTADVTFGYHRRPFVGESPTWSDGAMVSSSPSPQQPQLMGTGDGARPMEHQRARPQQQQRPPHSMGAGGGAGAVLGRWSINERGRSSNSGRRTQWEPGAVPGRWSISERGRSSKSGRRS